MSRGCGVGVGSGCRSASDWRIPTNPVHVLGLAFFLPAVFACGVMLLRGHPFGYATGLGQLVSLALTCLPIVVTPVVADGRSRKGHERVCERCRPRWREGIWIPTALLPRIGVTWSAHDEAHITARHRVGSTSVDINLTTSPAAARSGPHYPQRGPSWLALRDR